MSEVKNVLLTDKFSQEALLLLESQAFLQVEKSPSFDLSQLDLKKYHALIIRSRTKMTEEILGKAKNLQVIVTSTSGFDHIDLAACEKWGITVMFTPDANIESAAQLTWALVLACANQVVTADQAVHAGNWNRDQLVGTELYQKTYGIIGLGRIGMRVAEIANAFGMRVCAYDPYCEEQNFREVDAQRCSYEEILKSADVISYHVPKTKETTRMLGRQQFEFIRRGIILVNTSRGNVINENDLVFAMEQNLISACGLDVFEKEPLTQNSKLLSFANLITTPHIGANTTTAFQKASESAALKVIRFFMDSSTTDTLPPKAAWYGAQL